MPEITKYNFKQADQERMARELAGVDWDDKLGDANMIEEANDILVREIVSAAERAEVPKYKNGRSTDRRLKNLLDEVDITSNNNKQDYRYYKNN